MTLKSMTGFGAGRMAGEHGCVTVELRCLNHRFREIKVRLPRELVSLEPKVISWVSEQMERGSIEVVVRLLERPPASRKVVWDEGLSDQLVEAMRALKTRHGLVGDVTVDSLATFEGVVEVVEEPLSLEGLRGLLEGAVGQAVSAALEMRSEEGRALEEDLRGRLDLLSRALESVREEAAMMPKLHRERLRARLTALLEDVSLEEGRLETEVAILADRTDINEEITRLESHFEQLRALLVSSADGVGRKMGFLLQEINREINTIGSKSQSLKVSHLIVEMKADAERMREQVQNIE